MNVYRTAHVDSPTRDDDDAEEFGELYDFWCAVRNTKGDLASCLRFMSDVWLPMRRAERLAGARP